MPDKNRQPINNLESTTSNSLTGRYQNRVQSFAFVIGVFLCALLCVGFMVQTSYRCQQPFGCQLDSRINPNFAPAASMMRLPGLGLSKSTAIIAYRNEFRQQSPAAIAFQNHGDLQNVKGIGPKTAKKISQWLKFE